MDIRRVVLLASLGLFLAACAKQPEPMSVMADPVTVEPTYTGKL